MRLLCIGNIAISHAFLHASAAALEHCLYHFILYRNIETCVKTKYSILLSEIKYLQWQKECQDYSHGQIETSLIPRPSHT